MGIIFTCCADLSNYCCTFCYQQCASICLLQIHTGWLHCSRKCTGKHLHTLCQFLLFFPCDKYA